MGLSDKGDRYPNELSGGEQQRVSIARAFVNHPRLLIADEPTGNLDPETSIGIMQLLYRINRTGTTVIMATHDREMVNKMQMRVIALEAGKVVRDQRQASYARADSMRVRVLHGGGAALDPRQRRRLGRRHRDRADRGLHPGRLHPVVPVRAVDGRLPEGQGRHRRVHLGLGHRDPGQRPPGAS